MLVHQNGGSCVAFFSMKIFLTILDNVGWLLIELREPGPLFSEHTACIDPLHYCVYVNRTCDRLAPTSADKMTRADIEQALPYLGFGWWFEEGGNQH